MAEAVWCVFQKLEGEDCGRLAAVCASPEAARALVELSRSEHEQTGDAPGEWSVQRWALLQADIGGMEAADQLSHLLDPMRHAAAVPAPEASAPGEGTGQ